VNWRGILILTIALNPSVVRKIHITDFKLNEGNVADSDELSVGDCGIYSAYVIKVMQGDPYVLGNLGGIGGRFIKNFLDRNRIKSDFLHVDHETKTRMLIEDHSNHTLTQISSHNEKITERDFINIKHKLNNHIDDAEIVMISGSDAYTERLLNELHDMSKDRKKIILGAEGQVLETCIHNYIYAAVIEKEDLYRLGLTYPKEKEGFEVIRHYYRDRHIKYFVIKGEDEIIGFSKNKICQIDYHARDNVYPIVKSMVLGGITIGIKRNYPFEKIMKLIGAIADGCSIEQYPFVIRRKEIDKGIRHCKLHEIYNHRNGYQLNKG